MDNTLTFFLMITDFSLFSVLIANYNDGKYLMDAIESVMAQTYTNWEIVLVDDGSTDNSYELYRELEKDNRIRVFYNRENKGCGYTKNRCVALANGKICGFLDADDTLEKDALEIMVDIHQKNPDASIAYSLFNEMDENMQFISLSSIQRPIQEGKTLLDGQVISHFATFKKSCYNKTSGISMEYRCAEDHDLYYKLEEVGTLLFVDKVLYNYRTNTEQNTSLGKNMQKASFWHLLAMSEACRRRGMALKIEDLVFPDFMFYMDDYANRRVEMEVGKVRSSRAYRLGKFMLKPIIMLRSIVRD